MSTSNPIQWYPGHIAKLERQLKQLLQPVDVVMELVDARAPWSTRHPQLAERFLANKCHGMVLHKTDAADKAYNKQWLHHIQQQWHLPAIEYSSAQQPPQCIVNFALKLGQPIRDKNKAKGLKVSKPIKLAVLGMPNVGKSTLINRLVGQSKAKTGHQAGVTREAKWIQIHPELILLDTPGLIPPKLRNDEQGYLLACLHGIGEDAFDNETVANYLMALLNQRYADRLAQQYGGPLDTLAQLAQAKKLFKTQAEPDINRAALRLLTDFRHGRLGPCTLELPGIDTNTVSHN